ncbi:hypothetical protein [Streptomyces sp. DH8]|uniref:hypothetical protein n=1 Tax=Streptomyces sp. DH8 TaxID=2857008 RepID=UPI001E614494|nr:hypothetical protein [Streptomyces sp. DH8]
MACNCPHDVKSAPPASTRDRYVVVSGGEDRYATTDPDKAAEIAARWPNGTVRHDPGT